MNRFSSELLYIIYLILCLLNICGGLFLVASLNAFNFATKSIIPNIIAPKKSNPNDIPKHILQKICDFSSNDSATDHKKKDNKQLKLEITDIRNHLKFLIENIVPSLMEHSDAILQKKAKPGLFIKLNMVETNKHTRDN